MMEVDESTKQRREYVSVPAQYTRSERIQAYKSDVAGDVEDDSGKLLRLAGGGSVTVTLEVERVY